MHTHPSHPRGTTAHQHSRRSFLQEVGAASLALGLYGCGSGGAGTSTAMEAPSPITATGTIAATDIIHPGAPYSAKALARMRTQVSAGVEPWASGWAALTSSGRSQASYGRAPTPVATVIRGGTGENHRLMVEDMQRAYQFALRWQVSGETLYADAAVQYMDAWSSTLTELTGNSDRFLAAGLYGYQWALAGEMMRSYAGWSAAGIAALQNMLLTHFVPKCQTFLITHNDANITNYWANWDLCSILGLIAMGVFCDRKDIYTEGINYYYKGRGNGAIDHSVYCIHPGHLGQWQEMARDNGHSTLGIALAGLICEIAWTQGDDLYGYRNNRLLAGAEYVAKCQLTDAADNSSIPFAAYANRQGYFTQASTSGRPNWRPAWEAIYNHYANRKGLHAPNVKAIAQALRPERLEWVGDVPSFGTLTFSLPPVTQAQAPQGLTAYISDGRVLLSWWGSAVATSYLVQRSTSASGSFSDIATLSSTDLLTHTDAPGDGIWYYRVCTLHAGQTLIGTEVSRAALPSELVLNMPLNQTSGTQATDSSAYARHGSLQGSASWGAGRNSSNALILDGTTAYLSLPQGIMSNVGDFTIAAWVYWNSTGNFARVFDFGNDDIAYMCLMARDASGKMRFSITGTSYFGEQNLVHTGALPTGVWTHVAVTLQAQTGRLYVNGVESASNTAMDYAPFQLGQTQQNRIGRSQYSADPLFNGKLQDFKVYSGALTAAQIAVMAT